MLCVMINITVRGSVSNVLREIHVTIRGSVGNNITNSER